MMRVWLALCLGISLGLLWLPYSKANSPLVVIVEPNQSFGDLLEQATAIATEHANALFAADPALETAQFEVQARRSQNQVPVYRVRAVRSETSAEITTTLIPESEVLLGFRPSRAPPVRATPELSDITPTLPSGLSRWRYAALAGDFLENIQRFDGQYLHWTQFPLSVYIQDDSTEWSQFVNQAVDEWSAYIPMRRVSSERFADIRIVRIPRETNVVLGTAAPEFYIDGQSRLQHRVQINLVEFQGLNQVLTVTRHELGHALGLWGHSNENLDLMFSTLHAGHRILRVVPISPHSLNTLRRVYEQPTFIGTPAEDISMIQNR